VDMIYYKSLKEYGENRGKDAAGGGICGKF
jgi:hypothetical protein